MRIHYVLGIGQTKTVDKLQTLCALSLILIPSGVKCIVSDTNIYLQKPMGKIKLTAIYTPIVDSVGTLYLIWSFAPLGKSNAIHDSKCANRDLV